MRIRKANTYSQSPRNQAKASRTKISMAIAEGSSECAKSNIRHPIFNIEHRASEKGGLCRTDHLPLPLL
jgi:hypothetical protein